MGTAAYRAVSGEIALLRSLLPDATPDLSRDAVAAWPPCRDEEVALPDGRPFEFALSLFAYEENVRVGIRAAKYAGRSDAARTFAQRFLEAIRGDWADRFPAGFRPTVVPVPIRPVKYLRRGYNLPSLVALPLGRLAGWRCNLLLLQRTGERRPQAGLPLAARVENVRGAFAVRPRARVPGQVLLLDDVYTSGATVAECARTLKTAGAEHIVVLTVARAVLDSRRMPVPHRASTGESA